MPCMTYCYVFFLFLLLLMSFFTNYNVYFHENLLISSSISQNNFETDNLLVLQMSNIEAILLEKKQSFRE